MPKKEFRYYVYVMSSLTGTLYTGVTNSVYVRSLQHKSGETPGFTQKYGCNRLVFYEVFRDVRAAIRREKEIKGWSRKKKIALIESMNPKWMDLAESWGEPMEAPSWQVREVEGLRPRLSKVYRRGQTSGILPTPPSCARRGPRLRGQRQAALNDKGMVSVQQA